MYDEWMDAEESAEAALEGVSQEGLEPQSADEMLAGFVDRTPMLSPFERAELVGTIIEDQDENFFGNNAGQVIGNIGSLVGTVANLAGGLATAFGGPNNRTARTFSQVAGAIGTGANLVGGIARSFGTPQRGRVPSLPGRGTPSRRPPAPQTAAQRQQLLQAQRLQQQRMQQQRMQQQRMQQQRMQQQRVQQQQQQRQRMQQQQQRGPILGGVLSPAAIQALAGQRGGGNANATALLGLLMSNRGNLQQVLQQALQQAALQGRSGRREVVIEIPNETYGGTRQVPIPLGAIMNTVAALATQSMAELNASTHEADPEVPEYLLGEDGQYLVDPADPDQRAALVLHYLRAARHAEYDAASDSRSSDHGDFGQWAEDDDYGEDFGDDWGEQADDDFGF